MKKTKKKRFYDPKVIHVELPIYGNASVIIAVNTTADELISGFKKIKLPDSYIQSVKRLGGFIHGKAGGTTYPTALSSIIMIEMDKNQFRNGVSNAVHEICHAVTHLFEGIGMSINRDTTEAHAYLVGYITECFLHDLYE